MPTERSLNACEEFQGGAEREVSGYSETFCLHIITVLYACITVTTKIGTLKKKKKDHTCFISNPLKAQWSHVQRFEYSQV